MTKQKITLLSIIFFIFIGLFILILILLKQDPLKKASEKNLSKKNVALKTDVDDITPDPEKDLILYYLKNGYYNLKSKTATLKMGKNREENYLNFLKLLLSNEDESLIMPIPPGLKVKTLYYSETEKMVTLDLETESKLNILRGTKAEIEFVYFFVNNLCFNFREEIVKVKILVSGNEIQTVNGHLDLMNPFFKADNHFTTR